METKTGMESPQSISITLYYKGFSMIITKRDPSVSVIDLITESMKGIDWAIERGLKPSWNDETNRQALQPEQKKTIHTEAQGVNQQAEWLEKPVTPAITRENFCSIHKVEMKAREGRFGTFYSHTLGKNPNTGKWDYCNGKVK